MSHRSKLLHRRAFLLGVGASTASLAACSSRPLIVPSVKSTRGTKTACYDPSSCPVGYGGSNYLGNVDPSQFLNYATESPSAGPYAVGWNDATYYKHGSSDGSTLIYSNVTSATAGASSTAVSQTLNMPSVSSSQITASGWIGNTYDTNGNIGYSLGTITYHDSRNASAWLTVQGTPCRLDLYDLDGGGINYSLTYVNLSSGYQWSTTFTMPSSTVVMSRARAQASARTKLSACPLAANLDFMGWVLGAIAFVLVAIMLAPEAIGVTAAYTLLMVRTAQGLSGAGLLAGAASYFVHCPK